MSLHGFMADGARLSGRSPVDPSPTEGRLRGFQALPVMNEAAVTSTRVSVWTCFQVLRANAEDRVMRVSWTVPETWAVSPWGAAPPARPAAAPLRPCLLRGPRRACAVWACRGRPPPPSGPGPPQGRVWKCVGVRACTTTGVLPASAPREPSCRAGGVAHAEEPLGPKCQSGPAPLRNAWPAPGLPPSSQPPSRPSLHRPSPCRTQVTSVVKGPTSLSKLDGLQGA